MANHLELFFNATSIQGRLVLMMSFLGGEARRIVMDQIAFQFIRQFIFEATNEQLANLSAQLLAAYGDAKGARTIEMLIKPGDFSELTVAPKCCYNLNQTPVPEATKRKGIYANQTPQRGRGQGNYSWRPSTPTLTPEAPNRFSSRTPPSTSAGKPIGQSPLQRRNIQFLE